MSPEEAKQEIAALRLSLLMSYADVGVGNPTKEQLAKHNKAIEELSVVAYGDRQ